MRTFCHVCGEEAESDGVVSRCYFCDMARCQAKGGGLVVVSKKGKDTTVQSFEEVMVVDPGRVEE